MRVFIACKDRRTAYRRAPWATICAQVTGGFLCFSCAADYQSWRSQK